MFAPKKPGFAHPCYLLPTEYVFLPPILNIKNSASSKNLDKFLSIGLRVSQISDKRMSCYYSIRILINVGQIIIFFVKCYLLFLNC